MDVSDIFYFFCSGKSEVPGEGGRDGFFIEIPTGGGGLSGRWGGGRVAGRVFVGNFWGGGGLNIFFRGRNSQYMGGSRYHAMPVSYRRVICFRFH